MIELRTSGSGKSYKMYYCGAAGPCPGKYAQSAAEAWRFHEAALQV